MDDPKLTLTVTPDPERAARLARIDETARALYAQIYAARLHRDSPYVCEMAEYAKECWKHALALERARDEAVKELDTLPSKDPR